ncbi:2-hydroxymuconate tautomerase [compost metagenome]
MPNIEIFIVQGYSDQQKSALISAATQATVEAINAPIDSVRVWLSEIPATDFGVAGKPLVDSTS